MKGKISDAQGAFDWTIAVVQDSPRPRVDIVDGPKLDADGHRFWASLCWAKQTDLIGKAGEWPEHAKELALIAGSWKAQAEAHRAQAFGLEPV